MFSNFSTICQIVWKYGNHIDESFLTLRREAGVKLTPDHINCLILKNGFNICKPTFVTFNISLLALICDPYFKFMPIGGAAIETFSTPPLRTNRVAVKMTCKSLTVTCNFDEILSQDVCKIECVR